MPRRRHGLLPVDRAVIAVVSRWTRAEVRGPTVDEITREVAVCPRATVYSALKRLRHEGLLAHVPPAGGWVCTDRAAAVASAIARITAGLAEEPHAKPHAKPHAEKEGEQ